MDFNGQKEVLEKTQHDNWTEEEEKNAERCVRLNERESLKDERWKEKRERKQVAQFKRIVHLWWIEKPTHGIYARRARRKNEMATKHENMKSDDAQKTYTKTRTHADAHVYSYSARPMRGEIAPVVTYWRTAHQSQKKQKNM